MTDELTQQVLQWGPAGVLVVLMLTRVLVTRAELTSAKEDAAQWRSLFEQEQAAHRTTQAALETERDRMDAATESIRLTEMMLLHLGHQPAPLPPKLESPGGGGP